MALPRLREELSLLPGPVLPDGQPSWTLHDPVRNQFFRIDWPSFEILQRWSLDDAQAIADSVGTASTLQIGIQEVEQFARFLIENQLVQVQGGDSAGKLAERLHRIQGSPLRWMLHHYLFFRIPLLRPDAWLERWQHLARLFQGRTFVLLTLGALALGLSQVWRHWEVFSVSLVDTFNWEGLLAYGVALVLVKLLHELGHAFTAKRFGCRVPTMGVAFLVLWPMAYTDTNEAWRLTDRRQRLLVASAGILTELVIAAWATLAWALLPDGALRSASFVLATTGWVSTLAINASPFMRFDGYFMLSDWLDLPNLHGRSFALARWKLREWLFDLGEARPEHLAPTRERFLILFGWATWIYRLGVFLGIALLVYHFFIKFIGILLFLVELIWFILLPIGHELAVWKSRWPLIRHKRRSLISAMSAAVLVMLTLIPWPGRIVTSGLLRPVESWPIHAPGPARVEKFGLIENARVEAGDPLIVLEAPDLEVKRSAARVRVERLRWQAASAGLDPQSRDRLQSSQDERSAAEAELFAIEEERSRYSPRAPFAGRVRDIDPDLAEGQWLARKERIALLVGEKGSLVETCLPEETVRRIKVGDEAIFIADGREGPVLHLRVSAIDTDATRVLSSAQHLLAAQNGGHILARERNNQLIPEQAMYRVTLAVESSLQELDGQSWRGDVVVNARGEIPALRYLRNALTVLVREAGF